MGSIIFVHGTGVREKEYAGSLRAIRGKLTDLHDWEVIGCPWGDSCGAILNKGGITIPDFDATLSPVEIVTDEDRKLALWAALYEDPLYELRLLELKGSANTSPRLGQVNVFQLFDPKVQQLAHDQTITGSLEAGLLSDTWAVALNNVTASTEYRQALTLAPKVNTELREAIARALVAEASVLRLAEHSLLEPIGGNARDELVNQLVIILGGRDLAIGEWLFKQVAKPFTWYVKRRRGQVSVNSFAFPGDILLYQARGQQLRNFIKDTIEAAKPPVVLLAHSLGGIACVDLLNEHALGVELLITVGSQAPLLYEINALTSLPFGEPLKEHFPKRWLNIYDPRDFLGYLARGIFQGSTIMDVRVNNGEPFPQAHSAYWKTDEVWTAIRKELP